MAKFDTIAAAANAYKTCWASRQYLLRLAAVPLAVKILCFSIASIYAGGNYLLFMLILVPALVAEGWMLAHFIRFIVLGQTWPFRPSGDVEADKAMLGLRARGILSGMIVFVLVNMAVGLVNEMVSRVMTPYIPAGPVGQDVDIPPQVAFLSFAILVFMFWGFRLLWIYIPYALNMDARDYLRGLKGWKSSLPLIGAWLLCFIPFILTLKFLDSLFTGLLPGDAGIFLSRMVSIVLDTVKNIVTTAGLTFGLREIFSGSNRIDRRV